MVLIPKPGKPLTQSQSLRPFSLMFFIVKSQEKLLDRQSGEEFWLKKIASERVRLQGRYAYGYSTLPGCKMTGKSLEHKETGLGAFLDIEGAFGNILFDAIIIAARQRWLQETCCKWIRVLHSMDDSPTDKYNRHTARGRMEDKHRK